jgi:uncharacterized cupredoxin-like copper-binding protein
MTLEIFNGNTKNYTVLDKNDNDNKIELIKIQNDDSNNESAVTKQIKPKKSRKKKIELTKENQYFLNTLKTGSGIKIIPKYSVQQKE